jgi:hypothetical protein
MHETSRSEADLSMRCYEAFLFALKAISTGINRAFSDADYDKIWAVVKDVAAGERTLTGSPAELQIGDPTMLPAMKQQTQETAQKKVREERELAAMLLRASDGFVTRDAPNE